jgi:hypothetical protein
MSDMMLKHETIEQAVSELQKAGSDMANNLEELTRALSNVIQGGHFQGTTAVAFNEFITLATQQDSQMQADITAAAGSLSNMHEIMKKADGDASKLY